MLPGRKLGAQAMPTETAIVVARVVTVFLIFAAVLAWVDRRTTQ
jgi:hypothetical protein